MITGGISSDPVRAMLGRLVGAKPTGTGKWIAKCPAHDDGHASLSIAQGDDGRALVHCHAGCQTAAVLEAVGLKLRDLMPPGGDGRHTRPASKARIAATYDYRDSGGALLYQVVRLEPKSFRQRRPDGNGGWTWRLGDVPRVLYRLPELLAADKSAWVFVVEGEKDADNLAGLRLVATTNPGGAGKWSKLSDDGALHRRRVAIIPDKDAAGIAHAQDVAARLHGTAAVVKVIDLPDGEVEGRFIKDASDWIEWLDGKTVEELAAALVDIVDAAPDWTPPAAQPAARVEADEPLTDLGNAARLVAQAGQDLRYCGALGKWLRWDGRLWQPTDSFKIMPYAKAVTKRLFDAARDAQDSKEQKILANFAIQSQRRERLLAMIDLARCELAVSPVELDADPFLLNVLNGVVNLKTGKLQPHSRGDLITKMARVHFDPDAKCDLWDGFLDRVMGKNLRLIGYLQRLAGMSLTGDAREQELPIFHGTGANGKSVCLDTLCGMLGDYAAQAPPDLLVLQRHTQHPTEIADLCGRRLVVAGETEEGGRLRIQLVKRLTGDKRLKGRFMKQDFFEFDRTHKLILVTNNKPRIGEGTHAVWRRLRLVPFNVVIPDEEQDRRLLMKLKADWSGILNWCVAGCLAWQAGGLQPPPEVLVATKEYEAEQDPLTGFVEERCLLTPLATMPRAEIYAAYKTWADQNGESYPLDNHSLYERLRRRDGITEGERRVAGRKTRVFVGIGLNMTELEPET